jgi:hypothetical protein
MENPYTQAQRIFRDEAAIQRRDARLFSRAVDAECDDGIWLVSFMHYDLGYIDLEQRTLQTIDNPFGTRSVTHILGTNCYPCPRAVQWLVWRREWDSNPR